MGTPTGRETYGVGPLVVLGVQESCIHGEGAALQRGPELVMTSGKQGRYREVFFRHGGMRNARRQRVSEPSF